MYFEEYLCKNYICSVCLIPLQAHFKACRKAMDFALPSDRLEMIPYWSFSGVQGYLCLCCKN